MHPTIPAASPDAAVVLQLNIFGGIDEIPVKPSKPIMALHSGPTRLHDGHAPLKALLRSTDAGQEKPPKPTSTLLENAEPFHAALLVDPDEPVSVDLEAIETSDTPETILAKRMFLRMMWDIDGKADDVEETEPDLFGQTSLTKAKGCQADQNRLDALIWLYSLNPDGGLVTIEWVCDVLGFDPHRVRRIVGRSLRKELKRLMHLLSTILGAHHTQVCEEKISGYLDISNWGCN